MVGNSPWDDPLLYPLICPRCEFPLLLSPLWPRPLIPLVKVGLTPVLQWLVIPTVSILSLRHYFLVIQEVIRANKQTLDVQRGDLKELIFPLFK